MEVEVVSSYVVALQKVRQKTLWVLSVKSAKWSLIYPYSINYPELTPSETIRLYKTGSPHKQIQFIKNYEPEKYNEIVKRFVSLNMNAKLYI